MPPSISWTPDFSNQIAFPLEVWRIGMTMETKDIHFLKCLQSVQKHSFCVPSAPSLLSRMSIEPQMHNECLVCTCLQALTLWYFRMSSYWCSKHSSQYKRNFKVRSRKVLEFLARKTVWTLYCTDPVTVRSELCIHDQGQNSPIQTDQPQLIRCFLYGKQGHVSSFHVNGL